MVGVRVLLVGRADSWEEEIDTELGGARTSWKLPALLHLPLTSRATENKL